MGMFVMLKQKVQDVGSTKMVKRDESEWIKIPNHHESIVSKECLKEQMRYAEHLSSRINNSGAIRFVERLSAVAVNTQWTMCQKRHRYTDAVIQGTMKRSLAINRKYRKAH